MAGGAQQAPVGGTDAERHRMPAGVRLAVMAAVALVLTGALYLIAVRGEALLADLGALSRRLLCF
jgi:hypothetical protein